MRRRRAYQTFISNISATRTISLGVTARRGRHRVLRTIFLSFRNTWMVKCLDNKNIEEYVKSWHKHHKQKHKQCRP
jgi:hypothetical protein